MTKGKKRLLIPGGILLTVLFLGALICGIYLGDYYRADPIAVAAFAPEDSVPTGVTREGFSVFAPEGADTGFIFYPGGKVEHTAYIPLMQQLASEGIFCVLVEMPFRLAVLDMQAAANIPAQYPQIENWYIGGHSLGGAMAASFVAKETQTYDGLVLLGAYSTADLTGSQLRVLSVYGSEDLIMNREKYGENFKNLPAETRELILDGGCHSYFGMYGSQKGDGTPRITNGQQIRQTADAITSFISEN